MKAQWFWRMLPRQIASDLQRFFHRRIADWHDGSLSSFELLELFGVRFEDDPETRTRSIFVDFAPEQGAVAVALRDGGWTEDQLVAAETFNEIARLRASFHTANGGKQASYEPFAFEDPTVRERRALESAAAAKLQMEVEEDLFGWD